MENWFFNSCVIIALILLVGSDFIINSNSVDLEKRIIVLETRGENSGLTCTFGG